MISLIAAISTNNVIANNGLIPWDIKEDREYFFDVTKGSALVMGKNTFKHTGLPKDDRYTIVLSTKEVFDGDNLTTCDCLEKALKLADNLNYEDVFICGGEALYKQAFKLADKLYITHVDIVCDGDRFFPDFDKNCYKREFVKKFINQNNTNASAFIYNKLHN